MRFIPPPAATPGELMFSAIMELLSDKDAYKKRFDDLKVLKADASAAVKENNEQIKKIDKWNETFIAKEAGLAIEKQELANANKAMSDKLLALENSVGQLQKDKEQHSALMHDERAEVQKTKSESIEERNRIIRESESLDEEIERIAKDRAKLNEDIAAFNEKQNRIKLAIAS